MSVGKHNLPYLPCAGLICFCGPARASISQKATTMSADCKRYITSDPEILRGRPRLKGTRILFSLVLG